MRGKAYLGVAALAATLVLTGCAMGSTGDTTTKSTAPTSSSPGPVADGSTATPTAASPVLPTDCKNALGSAIDAKPFSDYYAADAEPGSVHEEVRTPKNPAADATILAKITAATSLSCAYMDPRVDITSIVFEMGRTDPDTITGYLDSLASDGYTCTDAHEGRQCQTVKRNEQYSVDEAYTVFARDDVFIYVSQVNTKTDDLIGSLASVIWNE